MCQRSEKVDHACEANEKERKRSLNGRAMHELFNNDHKMLHCLIARAYSYNELKDKVFCFRFETAVYSRNSKDT